MSWKQDISRHFQTFSDKTRQSQTRKTRHLSRVSNIFRHFQTCSDIYAKTIRFKLFSEKDVNKQLRHKTKNTTKTTVGFYFCFPTKTRQNQTLKPTGVLQCFSNNETNHAKADKSRQIKTHCGFTTFFQQPNQTRQNKTKPDKLNPTWVLECCVNTQTNQTKANKSRQITTHFGFTTFFEQPHQNRQSHTKPR